MLLYLLIIVGLALAFTRLPTSFLPLEDRGVFMTQIQLPVGSTQQQTLKVVEKVENYLLQDEKKNVVSVFSIIGSGPGGNGQNVARMFVRLKHWDERTGPDDTSFAGAAALGGHIEQTVQSRHILFNDLGDGILKCLR